MARISTTDTNAKDANALVSAASTVNFDIDSFQVWMETLYKCES